MLDYANLQKVVSDFSEFNANFRISASFVWLDAIIVVNCKMCPQSFRFIWNSSHHWTTWKFNKEALNWRQFVCVLSSKTMIGSRIWCCWFGRWSLGHKFAHLIASTMQLIPKKLHEILRSVAENFMTSFFGFISTREWKNFLTEFVNERKLSTQQV